MENFDAESAGMSVTVVTVKKEWGPRKYSTNSFYFAVDMLRDCDIISWLSFVKTKGELLETEDQSLF